jgi:hypothetical protein
VKWDVALRRLSHQPEAMQALVKKNIKNKNRKIIIYSFAEEETHFTSHLSSVPGRDPDPAIFVIGFSRCHQKINFFLQIVLLITYSRYIYISLQR